jgi:hypothetical protein
MSGGEFRGVGDVEFVDPAIDLVGGEAGGKHIVAQFISLIGVNCHFGFPIYIDLYCRAISNQTINVHSSL